MTRFNRFLTLAVVSTIFVSGCATTRARKPDEKADLANQVNVLQNELQAKDQQIQELQDQLDSYQRSLQGGSSSNFSSGSSGMIRVSGVKVIDVQRALSKAGFDPGPIDGKPGKKTKSAVKAFQRQNNLKADGIVGEKTWSTLNR
jgi:murein L,D-transpeptidase YcbB/YkuD